MKRLTNYRVRAWTLTELMMAVTISSVLVAGLLVSAASIQRSFVASRHHVDSQAQQMRLMDYMNLDLRRALAVKTETERLIIQIPDYYDSDDIDRKPRDPEIVRGQIRYGTTNRTVEYYRSGSAIYRKEGSVQTELATDVTEFKLAFQDLGQSIMVSVSFLPKFQFGKASREGVRDGTATYSTTLLRNKRQN
jgi:type II secretory pathway component PulJ